MIEKGRLALMVVTLRPPGRRELWRGQVEVFPQVVDGRLGTARLRLRVVGEESLQLTERSLCLRRTCLPQVGVLRVQLRDALLARCEVGVLVSARVLGHGLLHACVRERFTERVRSAVCVIRAAAVGASRGCVWVLGSVAAHRLPPSLTL